MRDSSHWSSWRPVGRGPGGPRVSSPDRRGDSNRVLGVVRPVKDGEPVVRTFGSEGDFRTEVTSQTKGKLTEEDRRQASLLDGPGLPAHRQGA